MWKRAKGKVGWGHKICQLHTHLTWLVSIIIRTESKYPMSIIMVTYSCSSPDVRPLRLLLFLSFRGFFSWALCPRRLISHRYLPRDKAGRKGRRKLNPSCPLRLRWLHGLTTDQWTQWPEWNPGSRRYKRLKFFNLLSPVELSPETSILGETLLLSRWVPI